jgi:hypothetical protein
MSGGGLKSQLQSRANIKSFCIPLLFHHAVPVEPHKHMKRKTIETLLLLTTVAIVPQFTTA